LAGSSDYRRSRAWHRLLFLLIAVSSATPAASAAGPDTPTTPCAQAEGRIDELLDRLSEAYTKGQCTLGKTMVDVYTQAQEELEQHCQGKPGLQETLDDYLDQVETGKMMAKMGC